VVGLSKRQKGINQEKFFSLSSLSAPKNDDDVKKFEAFLDRKASIFDKSCYNGQYILAQSDTLSLAYLNQTAQTTKQAPEKTTTSNRISLTQQSSTVSNTTAAERRQQNPTKPTKMNSKNNANNSNSGTGTPTYRSLKNQDSIGRQSSAGKHQSPDQTTKGGAQGQRTRNGRVTTRGGISIPNSGNASDKRNSVTK
jgi:hypothetical protein